MASRSGLIRSGGLLLLLTVAALCGCTALPQEWDDYAAGWRTGYLIDAAPDNALAVTAGNDCRQDVAVPARPGQRYAVVLYATHRGLLKERVALVGDGSPVGKDDWVKVNIERCDLPLVRSYRGS